MLRVEKLSKSYGKKQVVSQVSFTLKKGEIVGLLGPNGAGKTTSFYMTLGLVKPDSGEIFLNDEVITSLPMYKRARMGITYLPQEASVFRKLSVAENVDAVLEIYHKDREKIKTIRQKLLKNLNLEKLASQKGFTLSGGERRRCEIARALAVQPDFILLDEPFAGVDPIAVEDIQKLISWLAKQGLGILITDHNVRETLKITNRSYIIFSGQILESGTTNELVSNPEVCKHYLGKDFRL